MREIVQRRGRASRARQRHRGHGAPRSPRSEDYVLENEDLMQLADGRSLQPGGRDPFPAAVREARAAAGAVARRHVRRTAAAQRAHVSQVQPRAGGRRHRTDRRHAADVRRHRPSARSCAQPARHSRFARACTSTSRQPARRCRAWCGSIAPNASGRGYVTTSSVHPLTPAAAGMLLREPHLGVAVPPAFLRSRNRIAVGSALLPARTDGRGRCARAAGHAQESRRRRAARPRAAHGSLPTCGSRA